MRVAREEIFGPIMPILAFEDVDEAIARANGTEYGLNACVFTSNLALASRVADALEFGTVCINEPFSSSVHLPHGGIKESGVGKDCSHYSLEEYCYVKRVSVRTTVAGKRTRPG